VGKSAYVVGGSVLGEGWRLIATSFAGDQTAARWAPRDCAGAFGVTRGAAALPNSACRGVAAGFFGLLLRAFISASNSAP